ncbi:MAG TPA: VCBS repeat-containing protein [Tepidisphaeraceae bacterium]|nr:VCBS repeat-containing protein [Tepidisphaeraceae bacterium]
MLSAASSSGLFVQSLDGSASQTVVVVQNEGSSTTGDTQITLTEQGRLIGGDGGVFTATLNIPHALDVQLADVNGDGFPDLLISRDVHSGQTTGRRQYEALLNDGNGNFNTSRVKVQFHWDRNSGDLVAVAGGDGSTSQWPTLVARTAGTADTYHMILNPAGGGPGVGPNFTLPTGSVVQDLADMNGDGILDLVYSYVGATGPMLGVAQGDGKGGFLPGREASMPSVSEVVVSHYLPTVQTPQIGVISPGGAANGAISPPQIVLYQLDAKGNLTGGPGGNLPITWSGSGGSGDSPMESITNRVAYFNGDATPTLLGISADGSTAQLLSLNFAGGVLTSSERSDFAISDFALQDPGAGLISIAGGDVNGDGIPDLVGIGLKTKNTNITDVYVAQNPMSGGSTGTAAQTLDPIAQTNAPPDAVNARRQVIRSASVDMTTEEFLAITNEGDLTTGDTHIGVYSQDAKGNATLIADYSVPHVLEARLGDFNGDGVSDVLLVSRDMSGGLATGKLDFTVLDGSKSFDPQQAKVWVGPTADAVDAVADVNGDGRADLIIHRDLSVRNLYQTLLSNGDGTFQPAPGSGTVLPSFIKLVGAADLNGDGKADFIYEIQSPRDLASGQASGLVVTMGDGSGNLLGNLSSLQFFYTPGLEQVVLGDFDGDGSVDVGLISSVNSPAGGGSGSGQVSFTVLRGLDKSHRLIKGQATLLAGVTPNMTASVADLNQDGRADLVFSDGQTIAPEIAITDATGQVAFERGDIRRPYTAFDSIALGDVNRDGFPDLLYMGDGGVYVALNNGKTGGLPTFGPATVLPLP